MTDEPPFTEPVVIPCLFTSGCACEFAESFVRIVAWVDLPSLPHEPHERRIIARLVLPKDVARGLERELKQGLKKGSH
jgi:hypothetical protein